jgi:colanic acid biosynthesis glycosyl transferase WcaI
VSRRVIFINRCYAPSTEATGQLLTDLASGLASRGVEVLVLTAHPNAETPAAETLQGVQVRRLGAGPRGLTPRSRFLTWWRFHCAIRQALPSLLGEDDTVVCLTDPPLIGITVAGITARHGARLVHWVQDIYPELLAAAGSRALVPLVRGLQPARDRAWRGARACVTLSEDMMDRLRDAGVAAGRMHLVPNWAPAGVDEPDPTQIDALRRRWGVGKRLAVVYSGNLGRVHDLEPCLEAIRRVGDSPGFWFAFVGHGAQHGRLMAEVRRLGLSERVQFLPPVPRSDLAAALAAADVHWVTLRASCVGLVYPSKLHGATAAGRPILGVAPRHSSLEREIIRHHLGACFDRDNPAGLARQLLHWRDHPHELVQLRASARHHHTAHGGAAVALDRWHKLLFPAERSEVSVKAPRP